MKVFALYSGSKGNSTLVVTQKHNIVIDAGTSMKRINEALLIAQGIDFDDVDIVYLTHAHTDHVMSISAIYNKYKHIKFLMHPDVYQGMLEMLKREFDESRFILIEDEMSGKDLKMNLFSLKHDVPTYGIVIEDIADGESLCFIADNANHPYTLKDFDILHKPHTFYMVESNYDEYMQYMDFKRAIPLKRRVLSGHGHSDNFNAIEKVVLMMQLSDNKRCRGVMFHHLSEDCNSEERARESHVAYVNTWWDGDWVVPFYYAKQNDIVLME